jgi:hypothetical protein
MWRRANMIEARGAALRPMIIWEWNVQLFVPSSKHIDLLILLFTDWSETRRCFIAGIAFQLRFRIFHQALEFFKTGHFINCKRDGRILEKLVIRTGGEWSWFSIESSGWLRYVLHF